MCSNFNKCFSVTLRLGAELAIQASTGRFAFAPVDPTAPLAPLPRLSHIAAFPTVNDNKQYEDCSPYTPFVRITGTPFSTHTVQKRNGSAQCMDIYVARLTGGTPFSL